MDCIWNAKVDVFMSIKSISLWKPYNRLGRFLGVWLDLLFDAFVPIQRSFILSYHRYQGLQDGIIVSIVRWQKKRPSDVLTKEQNLLFVVVNCRCPLLNRCIQYRYIEHMIRLLYHCTLSIVARNANNGTSQLTPTNTLKCAKLIYIQNSTKRFCTFFFVLHKYEQWWN